MSEADRPDALAPSPEVVDKLVQSHREFLGFLEARLGNRAMAEELLQTAFVKTLEKGGTIRDGESAVAWFYRLLRNALTDHYRKGASEQRALNAQAAEPAPQHEPELHSAVCKCINTLLPTLKPEYATLLDLVDVQEHPLSHAAGTLQISPNNAAVRLHRARKALKSRLEQSCGSCATHGCLDCACGKPKVQSE